MTQRTFPKSIWAYVDVSKQVGDTNHLQLFASEAAAEAWFRENDPEGVAFEYEVQTNC
jgi:hypothetical protein